MTEQQSNRTGKIEITEIDSEPELPRTEISNLVHENTNVGQNLENCFNPFDINDVQWLTGEKIERTNQPKPDEDFPRLHEDDDFDQSERRFYSIFTTNIPCRQCLDNDVLLHKCIQENPGHDIYCFSEMYISSENLKPPSGFFEIRRDQEIHCAIIWFKESIATRVSRVTNDNRHTVQIKLRCGNLSIDVLYITVGYRSPGFGDLYTENFCTKEQFERSFQTLLSSTDSAILLGDFNFKFTDKYNRYRPGEKKYSEMVANSDFFDYIDGIETHRSTVGSLTCTDVLLSNTILENVVIDATNPVTELDHFPIIFEIPHSFKKKEYKYNVGRGKIYKDNLDGTTTTKYDTLQEIGSAISRDLAGTETRGSAIETYDALRTCVDLVQPIKKTLIKTGNGRWGYSEEFYEKKNEMDEIWSRKRSESGKDGRYKMLKNQLAKIRSNDIRKRREKILGERLLKTKGNWARLDQLSDNSAPIPPQTCANSLALRFQKLSYDYIEKIIANPVRNLDSWLATRPTDTSLFEFDLPLQPGCKIKHLDILYHLNSTSGSRHAVSIDGISREFLKHLPPDLMIHFSLMVTVSMATGEYLKDFRDMKGFAVFKKGNRNEVENYRPILVCSQVAATCEKMAVLQMQRWAESESKFHNLQMGFRENFCIGSLMNKMKIDIFSRNCSVSQSVILKDQSNAFGSADVMQIVDELADNFGLGPLRFWRSFITQTRVQVANEGKKSEWFKTALGVIPRVRWRRRAHFSC